LKCCFFAPRGVQSIAMSTPVRLSVCPSVSTYVRSYIWTQNVRTLPTFLYMLTMAVARCTSSSVAMFCTSGFADDVMYLRNASYGRSCAFLRLCCQLHIRLHCRNVCISTDILWRVFHILTEPDPHRASLLRRFTDTKVYGTGSVKIWKTHHKIFVDIRITFTVYTRDISTFFLRDKLRFVYV